jgi:hypothetical protein
LQEALGDAAACKCYTWKANRFANFLFYIEQACTLTLCFDQKNKDLCPISRISVCVCRVCLRCAACAACRGCKFEVGSSETVHDVLHLFRCLLAGPASGAQPAPPVRAAGPAAAGGEA